VPRLAFLTSPYSFAAERAKTADSVTQAGGNSSLGTTSILNLTLTGPTSVSGSNFMQFGSGVQGKEQDSGKIGYKLTADPNDNGLDIIGVGTTTANRQVKIYADGGTTFTGGLNVSGIVSATTFNGSFSGSGAGLTALNGSNLISSSVDASKLVAAVTQALCPSGTIVAYGGDTPPDGWYLCDGHSYSRVTDAPLFAAIQTHFGFADSSSFNVPDFRGRFLRGRDAGTGRDPDRGGRGASSGGGATGDAVGSLEGDELRSHSHNYWDIYYSEAGGSVPIPWPFKGSSGSDNDNYGWQIYRTSDPAGGNETRPVNISVNYIIKR
jgi:hypothetical protein